MLFIETPDFTRRISTALTDEEYGLLQAWLTAHPDAGSLIKRGGGIRKVRWNLSGTGKRSGIRVIYFWRVSESQILLLTMYSKGTQADLTDAQVKQLARYVEGLK